MTVSAGFREIDGRVEVTEMLGDLGRKCAVLFNLSRFRANVHSMASLPGIPDSHRTIGLEKGSAVVRASRVPEKKGIPWNHFCGLFLKGVKSLVIRVGVFWRIVNRLNLAGGAPKSRAPQLVRQGFNAN